MDMWYRPQVTRVRGAGALRLSPAGVGRPIDGSGRSRAAGAIEDFSSRTSSVSHPRPIDPHLQANLEVCDARLDGIPNWC